jgi:2-aminoethylphosphonate-pyruvate transaminase
MLQDFCTWDAEYNDIVEQIRQDLVRLATQQPGYTATLKQGSGTFTVEATLGSIVPPEGKVLVVANGAYGARLVQIVERLNIAHRVIELPEIQQADPQMVDDVLRQDADVTHVAMVHCETTTGMLNPAAEVGAVVARHGRRYIVDAMSSFGGIPMSMESLSATYLISSANKCIQGVPGFGFVIALREDLETTRGWARSLSLDLYDQWHEMETHGGKWRYTSPTHTVRAFAQAMKELEQEGGVEARYRRYCENQRRLVAGMQQWGFEPLLPVALHSPIITSFRYPQSSRFTFQTFYDAMKRRRFVVYPGKVSQADTFRIGTIGHVFPEDVDELLRAVGATLEELEVTIA